MATETDSSDMVLAEVVLGEATISWQLVGEEARVTRLAMLYTESELFSDLSE
jgi:hypothetical protein